MKKAALVVLLAALVFGALLFGRSVNSQGATMVERMFREDIEVAVEQVENAAIDAVLSAPVFRVRYSLIAGYQGALPYNGALKGDHHVWIKDDQLVPVFGLDALSTADPLDYLDGLIKPSFRLTEDSADQFMSVLKELMGRDQFESVPVDPIQHAGDKWYFLNGDFLSNYKGFVVTVDSEGAVSDIAFELSMLPKQE